MLRGGLAEEVMLMTLSSDLKGEKEAATWRSKRRGSGQKE